MFVCEQDVLLSLSGTKLSDVYQAAVDVVKAEKPAYVEKMTKSVGSVSSLVYTYKMFCVILHSMHEILFRRIYILNVIIFLIRLRQCIL